eukprot:TRINITY_DN4850_c0_g1_i5.p1 TRINITY_DN4850_c0_g1~~TRINITY_DN4850_c0_g1_i5.p1  ORF type:complete len:538 (-),score=91.97 TRINITY_DN4850_c0_g1_i5:32-1480(-)
MNPVHYKQTVPAATKETAAINRLLSETSMSAPFSCMPKELLTIADLNKPRGAPMDSEAASSDVMNSYKEVFAAASVDREELRALAEANGIPPTLRTITWQLLLGYLPTQASKRTRRRYENFLEYDYRVHHAATLPDHPATTPLPEHPYSMPMSTPPTRQASPTQSPALSSSPTPLTLPLPLSLVLSNSFSPSMSSSPRTISPRSYSSRSISPSSSPRMRSRSSSPSLSPKSPNSWEDALRFSLDSCSPCRQLFQVKCVQDLVKQAFDVWAKFHAGHRYLQGFMSVASVLVHAFLTAACGGGDIAMAAHLLPVTRQLVEAEVYSCCCLIFDQLHYPYYAELMSRQLFDILAYADEEFAAHLTERFPGLHQATTNWFESFLLGSLDTDEAVLLWDRIISFPTRHGVPDFPPYVGAALLLSQADTLQTEQHISQFFVGRPAVLGRSGSGCAAMQLVLHRAAALYLGHAGSLPQAATVVLPQSLCV